MPPSKNALLPLLLYDGSDAPKVDPWTEENAELGETVFQNLCNAKEWNKSQMEVLQASRKMMHRMGLVTGPTGSGKTLLQVHKGHAATELGHYTVYVSDSNSALSSTLATYVKEFPNAKKPVRMYARPAMPSDDESHDPTDYSKMSEQDKAILVITKVEKDSHANSSHAPNNYSVDGTILRYIDEGAVLMEHMHAGVDIDPRFKGGNEEGKVNKFEYLKMCLDMLMQGTAEDDVPDDLFSDDEERWFKDAYESCRTHVIRDANVLLTTCVNSASDEIKKNFAKDTDSSLAKVHLFVDEATTIIEPMVLIPLASMYPAGFGHKIVSTWMYGDLEQGPVVIGADGSNNSPFYNVFGNQFRLSLFKRLVQSGFNYHRLQERSEKKQEELQKAK